MNRDSLPGGVLISGNFVRSERFMGLDAAFVTCESSV